MSRYINPIPQYIRNGKELNGLELFFYDPDTGAQKNTFKDKDETESLRNTWPVICDEGIVPNIFYSGLARVIGIHNGENIFEVDNIGDVAITSAFSKYVTTEPYQIHAPVSTTDGRFFLSLVDENKGNDPTTDDGTKWKEILFKDIYAKAVTYKKDDKAISRIDGLTYISLVDANVNNEPSVNGGAEWILDNPVLDFAIGKEYIIGEKAFDNIDNRTHISQLVQSGNQPSSDSGTNWLPADGIVTKPANVLPADLDEDVSRTPLLTGDIYAISGSSASHKYSRFEVYSDVGLTTLVYKSDITSDLEAHTVSVPLNRATTYYWRVAYSGERAGTSIFSDATSFSTVPDLSEIFAINSDAGSAGTRTAITGIDLVTGSGSIWTKNRNTTSFLKRLDTTRNLKELDLSEDTAEVTNVNGLQQYLSNGFEVGTDSGYNGVGDIISSYIFKNFPGFHDTVTYTGNSTDRDIAHSLGMPATALIFKNISTNVPGNSEFWFKQVEMGGENALPMSGGVLDGPISNGSTSTTFNVQSGSGDKVNATGDVYLCELFADNPNMGITGGKYTGTGSAGLEITPGFKPGLFMTVPWSINAGVKGTHIADIKAGTSSHLYISDTGVGHTEVAGSVASWDNDKIVLDSNAMNESGFNYYYIIIQDPS